MKNKKKKIYKLPNDHLFEIEMQSTAMHCTKERKTIFIIVIREIVKYQIQMFYTIDAMSQRGIIKSNEMFPVIQTPWRLCSECTAVWARARQQYISNGAP